MTTYPIPTPDQIRNAQSESEKYRHLTVPYLEGVGVDIGSQGAPVVPWAISFDLPEPEFMVYSGGQPPKGRIDVRGFMDRLPFNDRSLPWIYSSHVIEDLPRREWVPLFRHWASKVKPGGVIVLLVPEYHRWQAYLAAGGPPNCSHARPEPFLGDVTTYAKAAGLVCEREELTECYPGDYTILAVIRVP